jgi:hypothetical protein
MGFNRAEIALKFGITFGIDLIWGIISGVVSYLILKQFRK